MKILKQGAEAVIYRDNFEGQKVLVKERAEKRYRLKQIDDRLRSSRMRQEMKLMREARGHGIMTPRIISSDEKSAKILMEEISGDLAKDVLGKSKKIPFDIGSEIGRLHSAGIIHGDLTTSNMIASGGKIFFIDFGLGGFSKRIEDMATDLAVLRESITATHHMISKRCWAEIWRGYKSQNAKWAEVSQRMHEIESRARYRDRPG